MKQVMEYFGIHVENYQECYWKNTERWMEEEIEEWRDGGRDKEEWEYFGSKWRIFLCLG